MKDRCILEEHSTHQLKAEIARRDKLVLEGRCPYCRSNGCWRLQLTGEGQCRAAKGHFQDGSNPADTHYHDLLLLPEPYASQNVREKWDKVSPELLPAYLTCLQLVPKSRASTLPWHATGRTGAAVVFGYGNTPAEAIMDLSHKVKAAEESWKSIETLAAEVDKRNGH